MITADSQSASLLECGYTELFVSPTGIVPGDRVRHVGERYSEAYDNGTAVVERMFGRMFQDGHHTEFVVRRDKPILDGGDSHGFWAGYATVPVTPLEV